MRAHAEATARLLLSKSPFSVKEPPNKDYISKTPISQLTKSQQMEYMELSVTASSSFLPLGVQIQDGWARKAISAHSARCEANQQSKALGTKDITRPSH